MCPSLPSPPSPSHVRKRDFLEHVLTWPVRGSLTRETASGIVYRRESVQFPEIRNVAGENIRDTTGPGLQTTGNRFEIRVGIRRGEGRAEERGNRQSNESNGVGRNGFFAASDTSLVRVSIYWWNGRSS